MSGLHFSTLEETREGGLSKLNELDALFMRHFICTCMFIHTVVSGFHKSTNVSMPTLKGGLLHVDISQVWGVLKDKICMEREI